MSRKSTYKEKVQLISFIWPYMAEVLTE